MKNKLQILLITTFVLYCSQLFSLTKTWNGSANTSWTNSSNWTSSGAAGAPGSNDDVVINSAGTNRPTTNISGAIRSLTLNSGSGTLALTGNMTISNTLTLNGGSINLSGFTLTNITSISVTANSSIISTGTSRLDATGATLTINGGTLTLNNVELVIDALSFSSNHDINSSNGGFLSFDNTQGHTLTSVDNTSHVNAKVRLYTKNGNTNTFLFPIGDGTVYSPFIFTPTSVTGSGTFSQWVEATYVGSIAPNKVLDLTTLNSASGYEYWIANASSSSVIGTIGLRFDNNSTKTGKTLLNQVSNVSTDLIIAQYTSSKWSGITSTRNINTPSANITTVTATSISPNTSFTLASNASRTLFVVPLPVTLLHFDAIANKTNQTVELKWETASEENNSYFEILHSTDFINWRSIGKVNSKGMKNELSSYSFSDIQPSAFNQYKLKEVAFNGDFTFSDIKLASFSELTSPRVTFYPNPASSILNLNMSNIDLSDAIRIKLTNSLGQIILENTIEDNTSNSILTSINIADLPAGIYQIQISGSNLTANEKIIVNH